GFEPVQVIGERWSARSQELRDLFSRHRVPAGFYDAASEHARQMLGELGLAPPDLPVVVLRFGTGRPALVNPSNAEIADAFGGVLTSRTVVIATGAAYRRLGVPALEDLQGRGVFYGAAVSEAPAMRGRTVFVAGGGNPAGQAALHLAKWARQVTILVRASSLAASLSDYLI